MNSKILILSIAFLMSFVMISCNKEDIIGDSEYPSKIEVYVANHFPDHTIIQVVKDLDGFITTYDVILSGNIELEFDKDYNIIEISSDSKLPDSVIPSKILTYVISTYPNSFITGWDLDKKEQSVELQNGLSLVFDLDGTFMRVDD